MTLLRKSFAALWFALILGAAALAQSAHLTVGTDTYATLYVQYAGQADASGALVYGGLGKTSDPAWAGKVVLVDRGENKFAEKLANVKAAGGLAVIIANNAPGNEAVSLGSGAASTLTAVTVSQADGTALKGRAGQTVSILKALPQAPPPDIAALEQKIAALAGRIAALEAAKPDPNAPVVIGAKVVLMAEYDNAAKPAPTFQWAKNGTPLAGQTHVALYFHAVQATDAGTYTVKVSNSAGSATSTPITLATIAP